MKVVSENQDVTDWLDSFFSATNFMNATQATVVRAFGLGTGACALWIDLDKEKVRIRHYDARMVIRLTWDEDGFTECAFVTRAYYRGKAVDQLQMHLRGGGIAFSPRMRRELTHAFDHGWSGDPALVSLAYPVRGCILLVTKR